MTCCDWCIFHLSDYLTLPYHGLYWTISFRPSDTLLACWFSENVPIQTMFNAYGLFLAATFVALTQPIWILFSSFLVRILGNPGPPLPTHLMLWASASHLSCSTALFTSWIFYFFFFLTSALGSPTHQGSFPLNGSFGRFRWRTFCFLRMLECVIIRTSLLFV